MVYNGPCIALITAVYERGGRISIPDAAVQVTLPMAPEGACTLMHVTADEKTGEQILTPVEFAIENGCMVFTAGQPGLFLLISE